MIRCCSGIAAFLQAAAMALLLAPAAAGGQVSAQWAGGGVDASAIDMRLQEGKIVLTIEGPVRAHAPGLVLQHADRAIAEVDRKTMRHGVINAEGSVRFSVQRAAAGTQTDKVSGRCSRVIFYDWVGKQPSEGERILVADLTGDVHLEWVSIPAPKGNDAAEPAAPKEPAEPVILSGGRVQVWLTAEGFEASASGKAN